MHSHARPYLSLGLRGSWDETTATGTRTYSPHIVVYRPPRDAHANQFGVAGARIFAIEMDDRWTQRAREAIREFDERRVFEAGPIVSLFTRIYNESHREDVPSALSIEGLMLEMLGAFGRIAAGVSTRPTPSWLRAAEEILRSEFRSPPTTRELADVVGVHHVHLSRAFRLQHGQTVGEFVLRRRIDHACAAILSSRRSLTDIAIECGFFDQSHFTKTFRRITGITPARLRQSA